MRVLHEYIDEFLDEFDSIDVLCVYEHFDDYNRSNFVRYMAELCQKIKGCRHYKVLSQSPLTIREPALPERRQMWFKLLAPCELWQSQKSLTMYPRNA